MLLFYEDEPSSTECDSAEVTSPRLGTNTAHSKEMDSLSQYGFYAFIPYLEPARSGRTSSSSTLSSTPTPSAADPPLTLQNTSSWTYSGPLLVSIASDLPPSFHKWASVTMSHPSKFMDRLLPLLSFLHSFLLEAGLKHYWLTIRATKPTHEYDTPRWHVDDEFFSKGFGQIMRNDDGRTPNRNERGKKTRSWKLATALLGPPTLFLSDNISALHILRATKAHERTTHQHECTSIRCLGCSTYADSVRQSLATSLKSHEISSPRPGELAFFRLGDSEGAVHSEPKCDVDRIFVNVVPGTEGELRSLMGRWGMEFPRAWCFGVPGGYVARDEGEGFRKTEGEGECLGVNMGGH